MTMNPKQSMKIYNLTIFFYYRHSGGIIGIERFVIKLSNRLHKREVKATTDFFCAYMHFLLFLFVNVIPLSAIPSLWLSYRLTQSWGRKHVLVCGSVLAIFGSLLTAWFPNAIFGFIGLAITGCGVGFLLQVIPMICHETNIGDAQGRTSYAFNYMLTCGSTVAKGINLAASRNFVNGWRWSLVGCGIFASPLLLLSVLLNETPQFLIKQGRVEEAKVTLRRIRKSGAEVELQQLARRIENEDKKLWKKLLHSPVLVINVAAQIFQQVLGLDSILFFGPMFFEWIGYTYHAAFIASFIVGAIRTAMAGLTLLSYTLFRRRRTLLFACAGMLISMGTLFVIFHGADPLFHRRQQSDYLTIVPSILLIAGYSLLSGPRGWTEAAYPEDIRALGTCCETTVYLFMTIVMNLVTLPLICALKAWVFALLAVVVLCLGGMIYKFLPEIGKKEGELPEEEIWKLHWFWKRLLPKDGSADGV
ncbi:sugar transport protein 9-like [Lycium barbarum]|uniref:sugar transport protein 9-like n=1 Tax=Lycium barbarum TaxID=112863 RepID=UPI00293E52AB|nr:sugar transport protein 9-like [Lycium barbarum]